MLVLWMIGKYFVLSCEKMDDLKKKFFSTRFKREFKGGRGSDKRVYVLNLR